MVCVANDENDLFSDVLISISNNVIFTMHEYLFQYGGDSRQVLLVYPKITGFHADNFDDIIYVYIKYNVQKAKKPTLLKLSNLSTCNGQQHKSDHLKTDWMTCFLFVRARQLSI